MKLKSMMATAAATLLLSTSANALFIDLEGQESDGAAFNIFTVNNANSGEVTSIDFDFVYEAGAANASWGSELIVEIGHLDSGSFAQIGTQDESCDFFGLICEFDLMWDDASGTFTAAGTIEFMDPVLDGSGDWQIIIADSFDDAGVDGEFLAGSFIEVNQVPVPATLLLIGLGVAGMGVARRRA